MPAALRLSLFFFNDTATTEIYTLSLHDALPIYQLTHAPYQKPELMATAPNQLWSWDITKLLGPAKWTYLYLYVLLDEFSRYVTGWMVAYRELAELAEGLIEDSCKEKNIQPGQLTQH